MNYIKKWDGGCSPDEQACNECISSLLLLLPPLPTEREDSYMKEQGKHIVIMLAFAFIAVIAGVFAGTGEAQAATTEYTLLFDEDYEAGKVVKSGNYYFKYVIKNTTNEYGNTTYTGKLYVSKKKNSGYKFEGLHCTGTGIPTIYSNGKYLFYLGNKDEYLGKTGESYDLNDNIYVFKYNMSTGKEKCVKTVFNAKKPDGAYTPSSWSRNKYWIAGIYDNKLIISLNTGDYGVGNSGAYRVYIYNMDTNKLKKAVTGYTAVKTYGKYVDLTNFGFVSYSESELLQTKALGKITSDGIKIIKKFAKSAGCSAVVNNQYYYSCYPNADSKEWYSGYGADKEVTIYKCNLNGKGKTKVATIKTTSGYGIRIGKITAKYCLCIEYGDEGYKYYKYTYATKTKKKISEKTFTKLGGGFYW